MSEEKKIAETKTKAKPKAKTPAKPRAKTAAKTKTKNGPKQKVISKQDIAEVERLAAVLTSEQVADYLCVSRRTFYNIMERQPEVKEAYRRGRAKAASDVGGGLLQRAIAGDTASAIFYLKTQCGWRDESKFEAEKGDDDSVQKIVIEVAK